MTRNSSGENITIKLKEEKSKEQVLTISEIKKFSRVCIKIRKTLQKTAGYRICN